MTNRARLTALRVATTRHGEGQNVGIKTPEKLEAFQKECYLTMNFNRDNGNKQDISKLVDVSAHNRIS